MKAEYLAAVSFAPDGGVVVAVVEIHHDDLETEEDSPEEPVLIPTRKTSLRHKQMVKNLSAKLVALNL